MDNEHIPITEQELLYDPMFAKKPSSLLADDPEKGIFGKIAFKKTAFIIVLVFFISLSMYFSFRTVSKDVYTYEESGTFADGSVAYMLSQYHGDNKQVLILDYVRDETDTPDTTKPVKEVGKYAVNCNESLTFIYISDTVEIIDPKAFYTCKNLRAFFVDENNPNYKSIDGVLYRLENNIPVEIMMCPAKNAEYLASLALGLEEPDDPKTNGSYLINIDKMLNEKRTVQEDGSEKNTLEIEISKNTSEFIIPDSVTVINELCFAECSQLTKVIIPEGVTDIETLAFFKCYNLTEINIPSSVINIGSDAFSNCEKITDIFIPASVKTIGHHAFYNCKSVDVVRMECSEKDAKEMNLGSAWRPEKRKIIMRPIEVSYNEKREVR